jgi:hypothetical protein
LQSFFSASLNHKVLQMAKTCNGEVDTLESTGCVLPKLQRIRPTTLVG